MRKSTLSIALSAAAACLASPAAAQTYAADRVVHGVTQEDLKALVASLGHEVIGEGLAGGSGIAARTPGETVYLLLGTACGNESLGCQGVNMQVRITADAVDLEQVNALNMAEQALNTWYDSNTRTLGFSRYVVLDHGITMENLRENIAVLLAIAPAAAERFR